MSVDYFKFGDIVSVRWHGNVWVPGRVVGHVETPAYENERYRYENYLESPEEYRNPIPPPDESNRFAVKVAINRPSFGEIYWRHRYFFAGFPTFDERSPDDVHLIGHDPSWDAFAVEPYAPAERYRSSGMYLPGNYYHNETPVWAWENGEWHPATVTNVERWISVRYLKGFRDSKGNGGKSYRTWQISPVISERSSVFEALLSRGNGTH
ncbi:hypothetical protein [Lentzea flava]|uniref:hypothetical protein n=1 Tax=Lentzea flava TaxID=103732 RepID=UPI0016715F36|nr:hypothetical protein [Lentzea flava]